MADLTPFVIRRLICLPGCNANNAGGSLNIERHQPTDDPDSLDTSNTQRKVCRVPFRNLTFSVDDCNYYS